MSQVSVKTRQADLKKLALAARDKQAAYGPDLDLETFGVGTSQGDRVEALTDLPDRLREVSLLAGFQTGEEKRSASYFQQGEDILYDRVKEIYRGKVEVMQIETAFERYDWLWDYWWRTVDVDADKYTAWTALYQKGGYFMRILRGQQVELPIQACLLMSEADTSQRVHNIVIAEEDSKAEIISGCSTAQKVSSGLHLGVSEFYIRKGAELSFTMVHNWGEGFHVRPRTGIYIGENGSFISNYIVLRPLASLQTNPRAVLHGPGSRVRFNSIIHGREKSILDVGSVIELQAEGSRGESISRAAVSDEAEVTMRGLLKADTDKTRGHLSCSGLLLSRNALVDALPQLAVSGAPEADLAHEASIGPVDEEAVQYLMSRGLVREEAESAIIQGFMRVGIEGLPEVLDQMVKDLAQQITESGRG